MKTSKEIALEYFSQNPEAKKQVIEKSGHVQSYGGGTDIEGIIKKEEEKYFDLLFKARKIVLSLKPGELTGKKLCELHDTYGIDPTVVEDILDRDLSSSIHDEYLAEREKIKNLSRAAHKKEVIKVVQ